MVLRMSWKRRAAQRRHDVAAGELLRCCKGKRCPFWAHLGFDCVSFTALATDKNQRHPENSFMGTSPKAPRTAR